MAYVNQSKTTFISCKLKFLKNQRDHLISDVGLYVSRIITAGESWTEGGDSNLEYLKLCQMIDAAFVFLCEKSEELTGGSMDVAATEHSQPSCEKPVLISQAITATASSSGTTNIQPAMLVQPAYETQLKPLLARISDIEEALCSPRSNAEKVAEQQSGIVQQMKELLSTLSESDKKHSSRFRKVKEQICEISDVQDAINEEHKTRLQNLERQLKKVSTAQDKLEKEVELQAELAEKLVHLPNQLEAVKENVDVLDASIERIIDDCVKENVKVLNTRTDEIIDECCIKHEFIKNATDDLVDKVTANAHTIQVISEGHKQKIAMLRELETRLKTLEADSGRNVKYFKKQIMEGETNLSQVIQEVAVMSPRLQQLELKASATGFGFNAFADFSPDLTGRIIAQYTTTYSSVGNNFDANSGIFTAPFDGLYVASVTMALRNGDKLNAGIDYKQKLSKAVGTVCRCSAAVDDTNACSVGVVGLKVGGRLFMYVNDIQEIDYHCMSPICVFTCFLLG